MKKYKTIEAAREDWNCLKYGLWNCSKKRVGAGVIVSESYNEENCLQDMTHEEILDLAKTLIYEEDRRLDNHYCSNVIPFRRVKIFKP